MALPATELVAGIVQALIGDGRADEDYTLILDKLAQRAGMRLTSENSAADDGLK